MNSDFQSALDALDNLLKSELPENVRLATLKEKFRLQGLYHREQIEDDDSAVAAESAELGEIRNHLEPLGLAPEGTLLSELARLAALAITQR